MTINSFEANKLPIVARSHINEITLEVCFGEIPEVFRLLRFNHTIELKLPDAQATYKDFNKWLGFYKNSCGWFEKILLEESQCN